MPKCLTVKKPQVLEVEEKRKVVPKAGFEPAHPGGRQTLNLVRLPFRHFGTLEAIIVF